MQSFQRFRWYRASTQPDVANQFSKLALSAFQQAVARKKIIGAREGGEHGGKPQILIVFHRRVLIPPLPPDFDDFSYLPRASQPRRELQTFRNAMWTCSNTFFGSRNAGNRRRSSFDPLRAVRECRILSHADLAATWAADVVAV